MLRNGRPAGQTRSSALWGTGNSDDSRSNALWGKGGRGLVTMMAAVLVLGIPLAASAGSNGSTGDSTQQTYVSPGMLIQADKHPNKTIHVIVTSNGGQLPKSQILDMTLGSVDRKLGLIDGISLDLRANRLAQLAKIPGLTITPDAPAHPTGSAFTFGGSFHREWPEKQLNVRHSRPTSSGCRTRVSTRSGTRRWHLTPPRRSPT